MVATPRWPRDPLRWLTLTPQICRSLGERASAHASNHPFAKYRLTLIREDPTLDEAKERHHDDPPESENDKETAAE